MENLPEEYLYKLADLKNSYDRKLSLAKAEADKTLESLLQELFIISDDIERGILDEEDHKPKVYRDFLGLLWKKLRHAFENHDVESLECGDDFDDSYQEAVACINSNEVPKGNIIAMTQRGYKRNSKILRTSKVLISAGPKENKD